MGTSIIGIHSPLNFLINQVLIYYCCSQYSSPSIIKIIKPRRMRWAGHVARMGKKRNVYRFLVGKQEGKRPLGRPRRRWIDNIKMDLLEI
jgi:ribosomal protein L24E